MFRITRKADYAVFILSFLARRAAEEGADALVSAQELASFSTLNKSLVANLLKDLTRAGFLASVRGARGGYRLDRPAGGINLLEILRTVEGPFTFVECAQGSSPDDPALRSGATAEGIAGSGIDGSHVDGALGERPLRSADVADVAGSNGRETGERGGTGDAVTDRIGHGRSDAQPAPAIDPARIAELADDECCNLTGLCTSKGPLMVLHLRIQQLLEEIKLTELSGLDNSRVSEIAQELFPSRRELEAGRSASSADRSANGDSRAVPAGESRPAPESN